MKQFLFAIIIIGLGTYKYYTLPKKITIESMGAKHSFSYSIAGAGSKFYELGQEHPLIVLLHDKEHSPEDLYNKLVGKIKDKYRFLLISSPYRNLKIFGWAKDEDEFSVSAENAQKAIQQMMLDIKTKGNPILVGYKEGADMVYYLATHFGKQYSFAFPIGGQIDSKLLTVERDRLDEGKYVKIFAYHGREDKKLLKMAEETVINIRRKNYDIDLMDFDGPLDNIFRGENADLNSEIMIRISEF